MDLSLRGKTALISGASQGIGKAIAVELSKLGANCILLARNTEALQSVVEALDLSVGQSHQFFAIDFN